MQIDAGRGAPIKRRYYKRKVNLRKRAFATYKRPMYCSQVQFIKVKVARQVPIVCDNTGLHLGLITIITNSLSASIRHTYTAGDTYTSDGQANLTGWDQMYISYLVQGMKYKMKFDSTESDQHHKFTIVNNANNFEDVFYLAANYNAGEVIASQPGATAFMVGEKGSSNDSKSISGYIDAAWAAGLSKLKYNGDNDYQGHTSLTVGPPNLNYMYIILKTKDSAGNNSAGTCRVFLDLTFYVKLFERRAAIGLTIP